jgi:hypothetical protein
MSYHIGIHLESPEEIVAETSISDSQKRESDRLKAEGDAFFSQKLYTEAYTKYSDAIKIDNNNAILYANRAASSLLMDQYVLTSRRQIDSYNANP